MDGRLYYEMNVSNRVEKRLNRMPGYVRDWYMNLKASRKTAATCNNYVYKVEHFLHSINEDVSLVDISEINTESVTKYYLSIQIKEVDGNLVYTSDSYQNTIWFCLDNFLEFLYRRGLIKTNYIKEIGRPKNHDLDRINEHRVLLTADDFKKILAEVDKEEDGWYKRRNKAILLLFMNTGMRKTALTTIMCGDIDIRNREVTIVDKGTKRHTYHINDGLAKVLDDWLIARQYFSDDFPTDEHFFLSNKNTMLSRNALDNIVHKYTKKALGEELSPHKLRAGYCSILYNQTGDIEFVRRCVGHSNVSTTQRYIVTKGTEKAKAAEIMGSLL